MVPFCYVYILISSGDRTYVGCTNDLKARLTRHKSGFVPATKDLRPIRLITYFAFKDRYKAFKFEKYLKSGSGRAFLKRHLI